MSYIIELDSLLVQDVEQLKENSAGAGIAGAAGPAIRMSLQITGGTLEW